MICSGKYGTRVTSTVSSLRELPAGRGFSVICKGKTLLSRVDPVAQCERIAAGIPVRERTLYLCPSPLYGYGLSILLAKLRENSAVLCIEADEELFELSKNNLLQCAFPPQAPSEGLRPLALARAGTPGEICAFARDTWGKRAFRRVEVVRLSGGWQLSSGLYGDIEKALEREIAIEWGNAMTLIRLGRLYARNLIRNLALLPASEGLAALDFASAPVLALGAGPSLDSVLEGEGFLRGLRGERRFKLVCVDTCLTALLDRGIQPDLVVILESQHWNLADFCGARGLKIDAALDLSALPASGRVLAGKRYFFATRWTELRFFNRLEAEGLLPRIFAPMGSVGLSAVALALAATAGPVITAGIDFSYTLDAYHGRSTPGRRSLETRQGRFSTLINAGAALREGTFGALSKIGMPVRSDPAMRNYRDLFEEEFGGNPALFDIAGPGLPLGIKTISPAEALTILNGGGEAGPPGREGPARKAHANPPEEKLRAFVRCEMGLLAELRETLSGGRTPDAARLEELLDNCDYLWAHFPECAGAARRPPSTDLSFLKRVRTEIEPFLAIWESFP